MLGAARLINESYDRLVRRIDTFRRGWAFAMLGLLALTYRLWLPSRRWTDSLATAGPPRHDAAHADLASAIFWPANFPRVPLYELPASIVPWIDLLAVSGLILGLLLVISSMNRLLTTALICVVIGWILLFTTNQHRLQPWAYQGLLYGIVFLVANPIAIKRYLIALTASVYAYSSLGKFDQQFLRTVGPDFVGVIFRGLGLPVPGDDNGDGQAGQAWWFGLQAVVVAMPIAELMIALFLLVPKTRRWAGIAAILMHGSLVGILGPWGLGHSAAVVTWNLFLAAQAWLLFVQLSVAANDGGATDPGPHYQNPFPQHLCCRGISAPRLRRCYDWSARWVVTAAILLPMFERRPTGEIYGYWDHWLSWSLYSPHTSRVTIEVHETALAPLPRRIAIYSRPSEASDRWVEVMIDRWSLAELAVPVYPQARFQVGVAQAIARELDSPDSIRIKIRGVADRRTGHRKETWAVGIDAIQKQSERFWLLPR